MIEVVVVSFQSGDYQNSQLRDDAWTASFSQDVSRKEQPV